MSTILEMYTVMFPELGNVLNIFFVLYNFSKSAKS